MFLTWVLQYVFPVRELLNKGGLNWGESEPFSLLFSVFEHACVYWGIPAECKYGM